MACLLCFIAKLSRHFCREAAKMVQARLDNLSPHLASANPEIMESHARGILEQSENCDLA